ncbi:MAG: discoidin domain-containing protein [Armatimonadota bacterium]
MTLQTLRFNTSLPLPAVLLSFSALLSAVSALPASAQVILSPTAVLQNTGGNFNSYAGIGQTIDQSGLSTKFTSGVTNFNSYIAGNPLHSTFYFGNEWFSSEGVTASTITYDLGAVYSVDRLALWNEEAAGINTLSVFTSTDPGLVTFTAVGNFTPTNNPDSIPYPAQVFSLLTTNARYVRLSVTGPQVPNDGTNLVGMGEIAFSTSAAVTPNAVPEPSEWLAMGMAGTSVCGLMVRARRRKSGKAA